jgi:iron complex outermembrane receptor protein
LGIDPTTYEPSTSTEASISKQGITGGNPNLSEETAKTWTAGIVWKPAFLEGFSATADWYNIRIKKAINTATAEELARLCVDQPTLNNAFCPNITRSPTTGFITSFDVQPQNVANFTAAGLDATVHYRFVTQRHGSIDAQLVGGYVNKIEFVSSPGAEPRSDLAQQYFPRYSAVLDLTWRWQPVTVTYGINWFSKTNRYTDAQIAGDPDSASPQYLRAKQGWEHNLNVEYEVSERLTVWAGVNNLFNEKPEFGYRSYPVSAMGAFFYAGAKANFH